MATDEASLEPALSIRRYRPGDEAAAYRICILTGEAGADATGNFDDPDLLGHIYAGPYLRLAPRFAFMLTAGPDGAGDVVGYCIGAADTLAFEAECERLWWPRLRHRYAVTPARESDAFLVEQIRHPRASDPQLVRRYPAHLHIDLLPQSRGRGQGRRLMQRLMDEFVAAGVSGVHLGVDARNAGAIAFYERLGFTTIEAGAGGRLMAHPLSPGHASMASWPPTST